MSELKINQKLALREIRKELVRAASVSDEREGERGELLNPWRIIGRMETLVNISVDKLDLWFGDEIDTNREVSS